MPRLRRAATLPAPSGVRCDRSFRRRQDDSVPYLVDALPECVVFVVDFLLDALGTDDCGAFVMPGSRLLMPWRRADEAPWCVAR